MDLSETVKLEMVLLKETEKGRQVKLAAGIFWFPKSYTRILDNYIYIPKWLADSKGIDYLDIDVE